MIYLDTSFLFKLYVAEAESDEAISLLYDLGGKAVVSGLSNLEIASALYRGRDAEEVRQSKESYLRHLGRVYFKK